MFYTILNKLLCPQPSFFGNSQKAILNTGSFSTPIYLTFQTTELLINCTEHYLCFRMHYIYIVHLHNDKRDKYIDVVQL